MILLEIITPPLDSLTAKLHAFIFQIIQEKLIGRFILSIAFFQMNHVHGLNQICHCAIHIAEGRLDDRNVCIPVSVRSSHVAKIILHISFAQDILAKYNHEKLFTLDAPTEPRLFCIHCHERVCHTPEYICDRLIHVEYHKATSTF